jgi:nitroreductase
VSTDRATTEPWRIDPDEFPADAPPADRARFLLRYAVLAPSRRNAQPWRFAVDGPTVTVRADPDRRLPVADPEDRALHVGLGCAVANLAVAAAGVGLDARVSHPTDGPAAVVDLRPGGDGREPAAPAAPTERRTRREPYADRPLAAAERRRLRTAVAAVPRAELHLLEREGRRAAVADLQATADRRQFADPAYRAEFERTAPEWTAGRDRDGPSDAALVRAGPAVGVVTTGADCRRAWLRTGRAFERLALAATAAGVGVHPLSRITERPETRASLAALLDGDGRPQQPFRLGYVDDEPAGPHTPRRPVAAVLDGG